MEHLKRKQLKRRLLYLFTGLTISIISGVMIVFIYIHNFKNDLDSIYFDSFLATSKLNDILHKYNISLSYTVYRASKSDISVDELILNIKKDLNCIENRWDSYYKISSLDSAMEYIDYTAVELENTNNYFYTILDMAQKGEDLTTINLSILEDKILNIDNVIQKLINDELAMAKTKRDISIKSYKYTVIEISMLIFIVFVIVIFIYINTFKYTSNIKKDLLLTTKELNILKKKLTTVSYIDTLTGLYNVRYFNFIYRKELNRAKRTKTHVTFIMLDIDDFQTYNEIHGYMQGDIVLKAISNVLKSVLKRPSDYTFRLNGGKFSAIISDVDLENSEKLVSKILKEVHNLNIVHENSLNGKYLTVSIGAICILANLKLDENFLLIKSEEMLKEVKKSGKDGFKFY